MYCVYTSEYNNNVLLNNGIGNKMITARIAFFAAVVQAALSCSSCMRFRELPQMRFVLAKSSLYITIVM